MKRQIEAALFDFGGVFTDSPFGAFERYGRRIGVDPERVLHLVFGPYSEDTDHPWHRLERGELSLGDARNEIMEQASAEGLEIDPIQVLVAMGSGGAARQSMVERVRRLRAAGVRTALVTNNVVEFREHWRPLLPLEELFEEVVDSSEVGMRKPNPAIFHHTRERLGGIAAERCVFVDDHDGNIRAAVALGMRGVLVGVDPSEALAALDALLAEGPP